MPNTDWKQVCAACAEGTPPERCAYYGDPNGCNAPTLGKHPEGDLAERLQEALEKAERRISELERAALAAQTRNCDRFQTAKDALDAFIREKEIKSADVDNMNLRDFFDWLFAKAEGKDKSNG